MKVQISECQGLNSYRRGPLLEVKSLMGAKIAASKRQAYISTVLVIKDEFGNLLAYKDTARGNKVWYTMTRWD